MNGFLTSIVLGGILVANAGAPADAQQTETIKLTLATGLPPTFFVQKEAADTFAPSVNAALEKAGSKYRIEWTIGQAGTIVKLPGIMQAVTDGIVDVGVTTQALEQSKMPLQNVVYYTPFGATDPALAAEAFDKTQGGVTAMDVWSKLNAVYLGAFPFDRYILLSKTPINSVADIKGLKIEGIGTNLLWLENTGAVGVVGTFATAYEDLQSGKVDATFSTPTSAAGSRVYEVAPYMADVGFGAMSVQIAVMNKNRFDSLPTEVQTAIMAAAKDWQTANLHDVSEGQTAAVQTMRDAGTAIVEFDLAQRQQWANLLPAMALNWAEELQKQGVPSGKEAIDTYVAAQRDAGVVFARDWTK